MYKFSLTGSLFSHSGLGWGPQLNFYPVASIPQNLESKSGATPTLQFLG